MNQCFYFLPVSFCLILIYFYCLRFLCFFISDNTKAYMFFVSFYCMHNKWKNTLQVRFLSRNSSSAGSFSLFFWFIVKSFHLCQKVLGFVIFHKTKALIFSGVLPVFCFMSSRTTKSLNFFCS